jgi:hypothetical protein
MSDTTDENFNARHPDSVFNAQYPYNQSTITRSGHEIHINDTPGSESIKIAHTKGSYVEIGPSGETTMVSVDKAYHYYNDGFTETVDGHKDLKIEGGYNINTGDSGINQCTSGDMTVTAGGEIIIGSSETVHIHSNDDLSLTTEGDLVSQISGSVYSTAQGESIETLVGSKTINALGDIALTTLGGASIAGVTGVAINGGTDVSIFGGVDVSVSAAGIVEIVSPVAIKLSVGPAGAPVSSIVLTPAGIIITSPTVTINGGVTTINSAGATNINSGGVTDINSAGIISMIAPLVSII